MLQPGLLNLRVLGITHHELFNSFQVLVYMIFMAPGLPQSISAPRTTLRA